MSYRWQETIKILIPGFYILCSIGMGYFCTHYQIDKDMCESINKRLFGGCKLNCVKACS